MCSIGFCGKTLVRESNKDLIYTNRNFMFEFLKYKAMLSYTVVFCIGVVFAAGLGLY